MKTRDVGDVVGAILWRDGDAEASLRKGMFTWKGILKAECNVVREESLDRNTLDPRRHQAGNDDVVERASSDVRGAPGGPVNKAVAADVLKERCSPPKADIT